MKKLLLIIILIVGFSCQKNIDNYSITIYGRDSCTNTKNLRLACYTENLNFEYIDIDIQTNSDFTDLVIKYLPKNNVITLPLVKVQYNNNIYVFNTTFEMINDKLIIHPNVEEIKKLINK